MAAQPDRCDLRLIAYPPHSWCAWSLLASVDGEAITHSFLDAVEQRERDVHAFTWIDPGRALSIARDYDRAADPGVLAGLPIAVKDVIDTAGIATEYGSPIYAGRVPRADAASVAADAPRAATFPARP